MANTKITTPDLINLPYNNTDGVVIPKGPTGSVVTHYLVVGGGGAGNYGGGGAGGYLTSYPSGTALSLQLATDYTVTVGAGGTTAASGNSAGNSGGQSILDTIVADGGGGGGGAGGTPSTDLAKNGGSGGGGGYSPTGAGSASGVGTGNAGGTGSSSVWGGGGGGGAGAAGNDATAGSNAGYGGDGLQNNITGTNTYYAGGGGAARNGTAPQGGQGGGGTGSDNSMTAGTQGTDGLGGGGGGRKAGGTGVVIIRVPTGVTATFSGGVTANGSTGGTIAPNTSTGDNVWIITATTDASQHVTFGGTVDNGRPSSPVDGEFRYNTTDKKVEYYDGSNWYQLSSSTAVPQAGTTGICNYPTTATALYQLNGNANDTCGSYNSNAQTAITYSAGKFNEAANFNGSTSVINFAANPITWGTTNYSISFWFNASAIGNNYAAFISTYVSSGWSIDTGVNTNTIRYYFQNNSGDNNLYSGTFNLNTWNHVTVTMDHDAEAIVYLNTVASNVTGSGLGTVTGSTIRFGKNSSIGNPMTGQIDQIRIFPSVLTAAQVNALYTETAP